MLTVLLIILILALIGALPTWPYSHSWGYYPQWRAGNAPDHRDHLDVVIAPSVNAFFIASAAHGGCSAEIPDLIVQYRQLRLIIIGRVNLLDLRLGQI